MKRVKWSNEDKYFGCFTYAKNGGCYKPFEIVLTSGGGHYSRICNLRISMFGHTLIAALPSFVKPYREWVDTSKYKWSSSESGGYWDEHPNDYGVSLCDDHWQIYHGPQTMNSRTTKSIGGFLPWTQWRHVRRSIYDEKGKLFWTEPQTKGFCQKASEKRTEMKAACPSMRFQFLDYDGEEITAKTIIEEREWLFGTGRFKWLSWFRKPKIARSLDIKFSSEVGKRKGSWKGGTVGHAIEMLSGELHESAFKRYCEKHDLAFIGAIAEGEDK